MKISVEDDDNGYLGIVPEVPFDDTYEIRCVDQFEIDLQNQTTVEQLEVTVVPTMRSNGVFLRESAPGSVEIGIGEEKSVQFPLRCPPGTNDATGNLELEFTAGADSITTIEAKRDINVYGNCPAEQTEEGASEDSSRGE